MGYKYFFNIRSNKVCYSINIRRKVTVLKGDSGTGKTTLIDYITAWLDEKNGGGVSGLKVDTNVRDVFVLTNAITDWKEVMRLHPNALFVADEGVRYIFSRAFSSIFNSMDCCLLCVTRRCKKLGCLTYSINEVYGLVTKKKNSYYQTELYNLYNDNVEDFKADEVVTEDSGCGYDLFSGLFNIPVVSTHGKNGVVKYIEANVDSVEYKRLYVIVDGAAYGGEVEAISKYLLIPNLVNIFAPESFEYLVLNTDLFRVYCEEELVHTENYADFDKYLTWEQYYTDLLSELMYKLFGVEYDKGSESWVLKRRDVLEGVSKQIPDISQDLKNY